MKRPYYLYGIGLLAFIGISLAFIGYATDTLPTSRSKQHTNTPQNIQHNIKKKDCDCCAEKVRDVLKELRQLRDKSEKHQQQIQQAMMLYTQHGPKEGLKRIRESTPDVLYL